MKTIKLALALASIASLCGCTVTKNVCPKCHSTDYERDTCRDIGGGITNGMNNHSTTAAELGEQYSFWAATTFGDGGAAGRLWFRKVTVSKDGRIVSVGPAEQSVKVCTDF